MLRPLLLAALAMLAASGATSQTTVTVTTTANTGDGSLRSAIEAVNTAGRGRIEFAIPGDGPHLIKPTRNLPAVRVPVEIDGLTQPGASCGGGPPTLLVEINGSEIDERAQDEPGIGLVLEGGDSVVRGIAVNDFDAIFVPGDGGEAGYGLRIRSRGGNRVECAFVGIAAAGDVAPGIRGIGLSIETDDNVIGGGTPGTGVVLAGSDTDLAVSGDRNRIQNGHFGLDPTGQFILADENGAPTQFSGFASGDGTVFGSPNAGNVVAVGRMSFSGSTLRIQGNRFGTTSDGAGEISVAAVTIEPGFIPPPLTDLLVGGAGPGEGNVGAFNLLIRQAEAVEVTGNLVGLDATGTVFFSAGGITLNEVDGAVVGGPTAAERNAGGSIELSSSSNAVVQGNYVGFDAAGSVARPGRSRISVGGASSDNLIGGAAPGEGNLISAGDREEGIRIQGFSSGSPTANRVLGNQIGTDLAGNQAVARPFQGIVLRRTDGNQIGGTEPGEGNLISAEFGVWLSESDENQIVGNRIGVGLDGSPLEREINGTPRRLSNGIRLDSSFANVIGLPDAPNVIAYASDAAIVPYRGAARNAISGNLVYAIGGLIVDVPVGSEFRTDGPTATDAGDADEGTQRLQNAPIVSDFELTAAEVSITYAVDTAPQNAAYPLRVEAFAVSETGAVYLGHDEIPEGEAQAERTAAFTLDAPLGPGTALVMTATDADGNTGESSEPRGLTAPVSTDDARQTASLSIAAWPNPARDRLAVTVVGAEHDVRVEVVDTLGRLVARAEGARVELDALALAPGVYVVRAMTPTGTASRMVTVAR